MKKRVFLPLTISHILVIMIPGSMLIACIIGLVLTYIDTSGDVNSGDYIIFYSAMIFLLYSTIRLVLAPKISLKKEFIYKNGDGLTKIDKIQYKCKVYYKDINKIEMIAKALDIEPYILFQNNIRDKDIVDKIDKSRQYNQN